MGDRRGVSSVADVSLALVLVVAAVGVFVAHLDTTETDHDPTGAAHTAETLGASTLDVTYSLESVLETGSEQVPPVDGEVYDPPDLERSTHGSTMGHLARAALANTRFPTTDGPVYPLAVGEGYGETLEEQLLVSLVGANFAANVTAVWEPFEGSSVRGTATFGRPVPREAQRSVARATVASELPAAREDALDAVNGGEGYGAVARVVAEAVVGGTLGDTQRQLETDGVERAVAVSRFLRFADAAGVGRGDLGGFDPSTVDATAMTDSLVDGLTDRLVEGVRGFETPTDAASAVSTGEITVAITTWTRER